MRKPLSIDKLGESALAKRDELGLKDLPGLRDFFLSTTYSDGKTERQPGVMIIRGGLNSWALTLKEPTSCTQLSLLADSWDSMLLMAEAAVLSDGTLWEHDPWEAKRRGKKR